MNIALCSIKVKTHIFLLNDHSSIEETSLLQKEKDKFMSYENVYVCLWY